MHALIETAFPSFQLEEQRVFLRALDGPQLWFLCLSVKCCLSRTEPGWTKHLLILIELTNLFICRYVYLNMKQTA